MVSIFALHIGSAFALLWPLGKQQHKVLRRLKVGLAQPCSMREKPVKLRRCLIAPFRDQALDGRVRVTRRLCMGKAFQLADFFKQCSVWPDHCIYPVKGWPRHGRISHYPARPLDGFCVFQHGKTRGDGGKLISNLPIASFCRFHFGTSRIGFHIRHVTAMQPHKAESHDHASSGCHLSVLFSSLRMRVTDPNASNPLIRPILQNGHWHDPGRLLHIRLPAIEVVFVFHARQFPLLPCHYLIMMLDRLH